MRLIESEVERRIEILRAHPILRQNKWQVTVNVHWLSNGTKIVTLVIGAGRYFENVCDVMRTSNRAEEAIEKVFDYATKKLDSFKKAA